MRDLDLKTLRLLVAVCDHGNIKGAAAQEHIEPSAISKRLAQLEDALGTTVLLRGRRGPPPPPPPPARPGPHHLTFADEPATVGGLAARAA